MNTVKPENVDIADKGDFFTVTFDYLCPICQKHHNAGGLQPVTRPIIEVKVKAPCGFTDTVTMPWVWDVT